MAVQCANVSNAVPLSAGCHVNMALTEMTLAVRYVVAINLPLPLLLPLQLTALQPVAENSVNMASREIGVVVRCVSVLKRSLCAHHRHVS